MSLLSICQSVAQIVGVDVPTSIVGNPSETAVRLLACAQKAGKSLAREHAWEGLQSEHTFTTVVDQEDYSLPSDYGWFVNNTVWDRDNYWEIRGPMSQSQWQAYKSSVLQNAAPTRKRFRVRNVSGTVKFSIFPTPSATDDLVFEYVSKNWCESVGGTGQTAWAADTDLGVVDEYLIELATTWRFLDRLGLAYDEAYEEYVKELDKQKSRDSGGAPTIRLGGVSTTRLLGINNVPDTGIGL